ncbi:MAG: hypothetical protein AUI33_04155 [Ignavibacteria bacterium 13_1_40CM_2_61_4]|nr:MAG: hypothetical protein AUI08_04335 [Gemmatimonadetes bacterium 13_2_20CM_2_65_7]OLD00889.1 MAG: hypothetical protein AUI89_05235 [Gemmatimonadetes bacterium 13_1_40CM_3_65_8]OLD77564.1 MAG: hypothetical protein AUI33_04155 [Ignavibacteria bacterium 13_1_40CM_2_61_4]
MNRRIFGALGVIGAITLAFGSCKNDPLSNLGPQPASLVVDFNHLQLIVGGASGHLTASVLDARATPTETPVTFTACDNNLTVVKDTSYHPVPVTSTRAVVTSTVTAPSCVVVKGGGFTDTVTVFGLPGSFTGQVSSATPKGGDTLTIASTPLLKFNPDSVAVTFPGGTAAIVVSVTADTVKVLVPFAASGATTINGVLVTTYTPPILLKLPLPVAQTGDRWAPGDTGYASAPTFPLPTATGNSVMYITQVPLVSNDANCAEGIAGGATGKCTIFTYNANGTDSLQFTVNWTPATVGATGASDIDIYSCGSAGVAACFEDGGGGATAKTPESFTFKPSAGVHYLVIEQFTTPEDPSVYVTITKRN